MTHPGAWDPDAWYRVIEAAAERAEALLDSMGEETIIDPSAPDPRQWRRLRILCPGCGCRRELWVRDTTAHVRCPRPRCARLIELPPPEER